MFKDYNQQLKKYNFFDQLQENYYVDAYDEHRWKVGQIKRISKYGMRTTVTVHFDGHSLRFDQNYDLPAYHKLATFRTHTLPYTGNGYSQTSTFSESEPKRQDISHQKKAEVLSKLKKIAYLMSSENSNKISARQINQFLRGQAFITADYCSTKKLSKISSSEEIQQNFNFLKQYIKQGSNLMKISVDFLKSIEKQQNLDQNLFTVHPNVALLFSNIQFLFILNSIIGNKHQRSVIVESYSKFSNKNAIQIKKQIKQLILQSKILSYCEKIMQFKTLNGKGLSWSIKKQIALLFSFLKQNYVFNIPSDGKQIIQILDYMSYLSLKGLLSKQQEQQKTIQIIVDLILGKNFQGKLRGLNEIKKLLNDYYFGRKKQIILKQFKNRQILSYLIDNSNFNSQIFKRSMPIFEFLSKNKILNFQHLKKIINLSKDKTQLQLKSFYSTLIQFSTFLDINMTRDVFQLIIQTLPLDQLLINLAKQYTLSAVNKNQCFRRQFCKQNFQFALIFYWNIISSQNPFPTSLKIKVIQAFAAILGDLYYSKQTDKFISLAIKGISNRKNLQFYFKVIQQALKLSKVGSRVSRSIQAAQRQINIIECVLDGLKNNKNMNENLLQSMFEFLQQVTNISKRKITFSQLKQFWRIKQSRKYFLKLLRCFRLKKDSQHKNHEKIISKQLSPQLTKQLIDKIFLDNKQMEDYFNISQDLYQTIDQLIIYYNNRENLIDYNYKHTIRCKQFQKIYATQFYLNVINKCTDEQLVIKAIKRFCQFGMRLVQNYKLTQPLRYNNWITILQKLSKLKRNTLLAYNIFLQELKGRMKSLSILDQDTVPITVYNRNTNQKKTLIVPYFTSIWKIRHLIGEQFNLPNLNFDMMALNEHGNYKQISYGTQQDFSAMFLKSNKQQSSIRISVNQNSKHFHLQFLDKFKQAFSETKGQQLFQSLQQSKQALQILQKIPLVKKLTQKALKMSVKDINELLDSNYIYKMCYQLKILNNEKKIDFSMAMIKKGFIPHISQIICNKNYHKQQFYPILMELIYLLNTLQKFFKMSKGALLFHDLFFKQFMYYPSKKSQLYQQYLIKCLIFLKDLTNNKQIMLSQSQKIVTIFDNKDSQVIFQTLLFSKGKQKISEMLYQTIKVLNREQFLINLIKKLFKFQILKYNEFNCHHFFQIVKLIMDKKSIDFFQIQIKQLVKNIKKQRISQQNQQKQNNLLIGYISLINKISNKTKNSDIISHFIGMDYDKFLNHITAQCLINVTEPNKILFKSSNLRSLAFKLIQDSEEITNKFILPSLIYQTMKVGCSQIQKSQWNISPIKQIAHNFSGIKNLAATCYINSLLQQLYFIQKFRNQIICLEAENIDDKQNIAAELQDIFGHLRYSQTPTYTTVNLCKKFILEGKPIDPRIQTDVDQFFHAMMDKLERNLSKINKKQIINNIFGGELSNLIVGSKCQHTSQRIQPFLCVTLQIKEKKNIQEAFKQFIKGQVLEGDNAYHCEKCDAKIKAVKRVCLKTLPQILVISLKRFQFDYQTMEKFKLNSYCQFPQLLNVLPFTRNGIDSDLQFDSSDYEYKLKGVLVHYGLSQAGHYTSFVQTQANKWNYFDDEKITQVLYDKVKNESFGGIQQNPFGENEQKKKNAYLLFYEKVKIKNIQKIKNVENSLIYKKVRDENIQNKIINILFDPALQQYMLKLSTFKNNQELIITYYHQIFLKNSKKSTNLELFQCRIQKILSEPQRAQWFLKNINQSYFKQFLFFTQPQIRPIIVSLLFQAFKKNQNIQVGKNILSIIISNINKRNMYPILKIIQQSMRCKEYLKFIQQIKYPNFIYNLITQSNYKIIPPLTLKIKQNSNIFGQNNYEYPQRTVLDPIDFIQTIDTFKVAIQQPQILVMLKRIKKHKSMQSLALLVSRRSLQPEYYAQIIQPMLVENLTKKQYDIQEQIQFWFNIYLVQQIARIPNPENIKKIQRLVEIYMKAIKQSLIGYKAVQILLFGLFRICQGNNIFRQKIIKFFQSKQGSYLYNLIVKQWIVKAAECVHYIKEQRIGYWRKIRNSMTRQAFQINLSNETKMNTKKVVDYLNDLIDPSRDLSKSKDELKFEKGQKVKYMKQVYRFNKNYGLVAQILTSNDEIKITYVEDLVKMEYY